MLKTYDVRAEFQGPVQIERTSTKFIVVHHAAALYPTYAGIDDVRTVHRYHAQKWPDFRAIGYHWAIAEETQDGPLARYVLSDPHLQRAHVALRNHEAFGISCLTNFTGMPAQKWIDALAMAVAAALDLYPKAQIVGHTEIARPGYETACPGPTWPLWRPVLLAKVGAIQGQLNTTITDEHPIIGPNSITTDQAVAFILSRPHGEYTEYDIRRVILPAYEQVCAEAGVDLGVAVAQMIHETGNLTSFWASRPQRNPAGIGVNGEYKEGSRFMLPPGADWAYNTQRKRWERGLSFATWDRHGIPAQVWRLLGYAATDAQLTAAQRKALEAATRGRPLPPSARGSAQTLRQLGAQHNPANLYPNGTPKPKSQWVAGWAWPGADYGARIAAIITAIRRNQPL